MNKTPFQILCDAITTICFIICTCTLLQMCSTQHRINKERIEYIDNFNAYMALKTQYDTTTNYNRIKIWPQLKDAENKIK